MSMTQGSRAPKSRVLSLRLFRQRLTACPWEAQSYLRKARENSLHFSVKCGLHGVGTPLTPRDTENLSGNLR